MSTNGYRTNRLVSIDIPNYHSDITTKDAECCDKMVEGVHTLDIACQMAAANGTPIKMFPMQYCPWCGKSFTQSAKEYIESKTKT